MPSTEPASPRADRVTRLAVKGVVFSVAAFCALLLVVRLVAYPAVEAHRADIAQWLGSRIGQPVEIDAIVTGWDGWNPKLSIRGFRVRARAGAGAATLLELPRVDLIIAWTSVPLLDVRLKTLLIESPRLSVRRDSNGRLHLAGIEIDPSEDVDDSGFADWVMRQPQVVVRDALVAWNDELRHAPQLLLDHVEFRLVQRFGHHAAGLTGVPPPEISAPIDLRADVVGSSLKDLQSLQGKLYLRLDYADVAAWREWLPVPVGIDRGKGALRLWVDFAGSQTNGVVADFELADVRATLGNDIAPLALEHVAGRIAWKRSGARSEFTATGLSLSLPDGTGLAPTDLAVMLIDAGRTPGGGIVTLKEADVAPLASVAAHFPLPDAVRRGLDTFRPHGVLRNARFEWDGEIDAPVRYLVKADVQHFAIASHDSSPGASNVSGSIDATDRGGHLAVAAEPMTITLPHLFGDAVALDSLSGDFDWTRAGGETEVKWSNLAFANADVAGTSTGAWRSRPAGPGEVDLRVQMTRAALASAHHYVPVAASAALRDWLRRAIVKGTSDDASLVLAGDLALFPFPEGNGGRFQLAVKARDATLDYADRWPPITGIAADVRIDGTRIAVAATSASVQGTAIGATRADVLNFRDQNPTLQIEGSASGPTTQFLAFIANSPVAGWIGHVTDGAGAAGDGALSLKFDLPLHDPARAVVTGQYQFIANSLQIAGLPPLSAVAGNLAFSDHGARAEGVAAEIFGGPATLALSSTGDGVQVTAKGSAGVDAVRSAFDVPLLDRVKGVTDWQLTLDARDRNVAWTLESSLRGAAVELPFPIGKKAADPVPLRIERRGSTVASEDRIVVDYGNIAKILVHRQANGDAFAIDRALVLVGKSAQTASQPELPGVWIRADVPSINIDDWLAVDVAPAGASSRGGGDALSIGGVDLQAASLQAFGRNFSRVTTTARRDGPDWRLVLDGEGVAGTATWRGATAATPNGRIVARLTRLATPPAAEAGAPPGSDAVPSPPESAPHWPAVDLVAQTLLKKGRALGKLELLAQPSEGDWQINKLALSNESGRIDAHGWWRNAGVRSQTRLDVAIDVTEAGAFLGRFGWPDAVNGAPTKIDGQVSWMGSPSDFDYPSLAGSFRLRSGAGQFTKLDPGVGRLLGVLSLQALPRRISLDFRDVFSEGFAFDNVVGDVRMESGVMHTDGLRLAGPAAAVNIAGDVDLSDETQQLKVRVQPSLSSGVSAGAAALFIANPLLGAAVGAGALLAQKMLNNPFDQLFSYEYAVTGSWDDPVVARVGAGVLPASPSSATAR